MGLLGQVGGQSRRTPSRQRHGPQVALAGELQSAGGAVALALLKTLLVGIVLAVLLAKVIEFLLKRHYIPDFLESVFLLAVVAVAFAVSNAIQKASTGGNVNKLMKDAAKKAERILKRAGYY